MGYRPDIDGLRALAVVPVILFHAGIPGFPGGFVGVDIFFVISGFLITSIIRREMVDGNFSLIRFYERRARRILPALILVMAVCIPVSALLMLPVEREDLARSIIATLTFTSNFFFWQTSGYFATEAELKPLLHTWSLAVEEQFYLFFPLLLMFFRNRSLRAVGAILFALSLMSLVLAEWTSRLKPDASYYLLITRAWELGAGAILALGIDELRRNWLDARPRLAEGLTAVGLGLIICSVLMIDKTMPFPGFYAIAPVLGATLIIAAGRPDSRISQLLSLRAVVFIGLISYSAYLWHKPLFAFLRMASFGEAETLHFAAMIPVVFGLSYLSWKYVEIPFRHASQGGPFRTLVVSCSACGTLFVLALTMIVSTPDEPLTAREESPANCHWMKFEEAGRDCNILASTSAGERLVVLWGDSFADAFLLSLARRFESRPDLTLYPIISHSCPALSNTQRNDSQRLGLSFADRCRSFQDRASARIADMHPDAVILSNALLGYATMINHYTSEPVLLHDDMPGAGGDAIVTRSLVETVQFLRSIGSDVILATPHPPIGDLRHRLRRTMLTGFDPVDYRLDTHAAFALRDRILGALDETGLDVTEISPADHLCRDTAAGSLCFGLSDRQELLFFDNSHISTAIAPHMADRIMGILANI